MTTLIIGKAPSFLRSIVVLDSAGMVDFVVSTVFFVLIDVSVFFLSIPFLLQFQPINTNVEGYQCWGVGGEPNLQCQGVAISGKVSLPSVHFGEFLVFH